MSISVVYTACLVLLSITNAQEQVPCDVRYPDWGEGDSFVCVCNATYCDTFPPLEAPNLGSYLWVTSDKSRARFDHSLGIFGPVDRMKPDYSVTDAEGQKVLGFGGAITDSAALNVLSMSTPTQDNLLRSYYSPEGLEYTINRINIGGCDFSTRGYTHVDTEDDVDLETFQLQAEDLDMKIPLLHRAAAMSSSPLLTIAAAWSAPAWMKGSHSLVGFGRLLPDMYQPWAEYHVKFLDAYAAHNVSIWGMSAQNEPLNGNVPLFPFNCMGWTAQTQKKFIGENLGPLLEARGYGDLHLMVMDDQRLKLPQWPQEVFGDSAASRYADGIAVHWYLDKLSTDRLDDTHRLMPDKFILSTEACNGDGPLEPPVVLGSWGRLEAYALDIIEDLEHWVIGWVDWNIALDQQGGPNWCRNFVDSPIIVDPEKDEFYKNPTFYGLGHFSKFIRPGAVHLKMTSHTNTGLETTAFRNTDDTVAIVLLNTQELPVLVSIGVADRGIISATVEARSINSILYQ